MRHKRTCGLGLVALSGLTGSTALAVQFSYLDPTYNQQIYTGTAPLMGTLGAWTPSGDLLTRSGSNILEYSPTQNVVIQGTNIHGVTATHTISGLSSSGYGMTNGLDGYIYTVTGAGVERFNPSNWAAPAQLMPSSMPGTGYGITTLPDGRIAYSDGTGASHVWIYDPTSFTNTLIYTASNLVDGMVSGPTGDIAITNHNAPAGIEILSNTGTVLNSFTTTHYPDGLAFAASASASILYSNNNDGTISKYSFPSPGYLGTPTITDIATGSHAYGDLAAVGPDCAFYVSQYDNFGQNGSTAGVGTNWDNSVTTNDPSITRIGGGVMPDGTTVCEFYSPLETSVPEPASVAVLVGGATLSILRPRRRKMA